MIFLKKSLFFENNELNLISQYLKYQVLNGSKIFKFNKNYRNMSRDFILKIL